MLKKRRRKIKREKTNKNKPSCKNYKENIGTKLITNTKKQKLKIQSLEFQKYSVKTQRRRKRKREKTNKTNQVAKIIKKIQVQN